MPGDQSRGRSWREQAGGTERKREGQPQWRREPATPAAAPAVKRLSRKTKIGFAALAFLVFCGLLVFAVLLLIPPKPAVLVPLYAGYEDNLAVPANPYGRISAQDLEAMAESGLGSFVWGSGALRLKSKASEVRTDEPWDKDLNDFKEKTVVVFLALHGGADPDGAYLLPANSNGRPDEKNRLRMKKVLERLGQIDKTKNKVIIIDATQVSADWPLGILHNGFARQLDLLNDDIAAIPNLIVMSASDVNQRSWVSEEWRQTIFSHYVIEGLKGAAGKESGGRINALDLHKYVQQNVERWVRSNREASQRPVLLPRGDKGEALARNMELVVIKENYQAPNPRELPNFEPAPELQKAWLTFQELENDTPSPAVYAPQIWKQYQGYLLRYEQMCRADDKGAAGRLAAKLTELEQQLKHARLLELSSGQNTLPMPAAAGAGRYQPDRLGKAFNDLWEVPQANRAQTWDDIQKTEKATTKSAKQQLLRAQLGELLVRRVMEDPAGNLEKGAQVAAALEEAVSPRPAELHFLVMLNRDRPKNPQPASEYYAAVKMALELRLLAEKTAFNLAAEAGHPYSERVYPWIQTLVDKADQDRRFGQDLLFAEDPKRWAEARDLFQKAKKNYQDAQEIGEAVRAALAARDLAYARLPAYSQWAAQRHSTDDAERQHQDAELLRSLEELWREVHRLDRLLEKPNPRWIKETPPPDAEDTQPKSLQQCPGVVSQGMNKVRSQFDDLCKRLVISANLQIDWYDAEGALAVPFMDANLRMKLLANSRRITHTLLTETGDKPSEATGSEKKEEENAQKEANRQGRMALADLGKRWFDACKPGELETFEQVHSRIDTLVAAPNWGETLAKAENQIGARWQQMPVESNTRTEGALKSAVDPAREALQFADRLGHLMDAGSGSLLTRDPVQDYRRLMFLGFLNWQAQRTFEDHWFDLDPRPDQPPYYRTAGTLYLDDARKLTPQAQRLQAVEELQKKLNQPGKLLVDGPARLNVTSEQRFAVTYRIQPPQDEFMPLGNPVAGIKIGKDLQLVNPSEADRAVHALTGKDQPLAPISVSLESPMLLKAENSPPAPPTPVPSNITLAGLYRGQLVEKETRVTLYPSPEIARVQPPPPEKASLAVRAEPALLQKFAPNKGALAIVLDCSGSMWYPHPDALPPPAKVPEDCRFMKAVRALEKVLEGLPKETVVGLWHFGQYQEDGKITLMRSPAPWKPEQLAPLMKQVRNLRPYFGTPLVKSIQVAKDGLPKGVEGFQSVVVLTDGRDEEFKETGGLDGITDIKEYMEKKILKDSNLMVNIVSFEATKNDVDIVKRDFAIIEDKKLPVPGKLFFIEKDPNELARKLSRAMRQGLRYWVENPDGTAPSGLDDSLEVSEGGSGQNRANDQWVPAGLPPAGYNVWVQTNQRARQKILLERGDLLLMQLNKDLNFERLVFSKEDYPGKISVESDESKPERWRVAVLQNQKVGDRSLQMLTTLERLSERRAITLQQVKPHDVWWEVLPPPSGKAPFGTRWAYQYGYPAAAWGLNVPEWPSASSGVLASPQLRAWWSPDQEAVSAAVLQHGADFTSAKELTDRPIQVEGDKDVLESVSVEEHWVEDRTGQKQKLPCLVVRFAYAKDKPVWAKIAGNGWKMEGSEHRFYLDANKYTGLFWPVPPNAVESLAKLSFISLETFKQEAVRRGFALELKDAKVPEAGDDRPTARLLLK
jgi:hypothetical protein